MMFLGKDIKNIPGISFINKENKFIDNGSSKRIEHIDKIPRPAWHLLKPQNYFTDYFTIGLAKGKLRNMPILATRGCPYQCTFCSSPTMWTTRYIMRDPKEIVNEIEWLIKEYEAREEFGTRTIEKRDGKTEKVRDIYDSQGNKKLTKKNTF